jgi:hypothetical protein
LGPIQFAFFGKGSLVTVLTAEVTAVEDMPLYIERVTGAWVVHESYLCQGAFLKNRPVDPRKTFNYQKLWEVQKPFLEKVSG